MERAGVGGAVSSTGRHRWEIEPPDQPGRVVLDWSQDPAHRDLTGGYLQCSWQAAPLRSRRLWLAPPSMGWSQTLERSLSA
jgi:hypothetical protein